LKIQSVPHTYIIKGGNLVDQFVGVPATETIKSSIQKALDMKEVEIAVHEEGEGELVPKFSIVTVHYTGKFENGEVFDSSVTKGIPFKFKVGAGQVIAGWDIAVC